MPFQHSSSSLGNTWHLQAPEVQHKGTLGFARPSFPWWSPRGPPDAHLWDPITDFGRQAERPRKVQALRPRKDGPQRAAHLQAGLPSTATSLPLLSANTTCPWAPAHTGLCQESPRHPDRSCSGTLPACRPAQERLQGELGSQGTARQGAQQGCVQSSEEGRPHLSPP